MLENRESLVERSVEHIVDQLVSQTDNWLLSVKTTDRKGFMSWQRVLNKTESALIDEYGDIRFLFLLVDHDIICRIDKREKEYELFLTKRI